jgi:RNA recognition motif-containing protein
MATKIFVGNLNFNTTRDELEALFAQVAQPRDVFMPNDRETGRPRGFAFIEYESDDDAAQAIERFNGHEIGGRALRVNAAEDRPRQSGGGMSFRPEPGGGGYGGGAGAGGGRGGDRGGAGKPKGSRRNMRAKKRSL